MTGLLWYYGKDLTAATVTNALARYHARQGRAATRLITRPGVVNPTPELQHSVDPGITPGHFMLTEDTWE